MVVYISIGIVVLLLIFIIAIYNRLVKANNIVKEAFSGIDVQLQKRFELIPNLVDTVKEYNQHEASTLNAVVQNRNKNNNNIKETAKNDRAVTQKLERFKVQIEDYPELKSNTQFLKLMDSLSTVEDELAMSRRYYNGTARDFNIKMEVFPNNIMAPIFNFTKVDFYNFEGSSKAAPEVNLND